MASLATAGNVHSTCLRILRARGYALAREIGRYEEDDGPHGYRAEKDGFSFSADNPIELLGLVAIYEHVAPAADEPYWWHVEGPNIEDELLERGFEASLAELRGRDPSRWVRVIREALAAADEDASAAEILGISEANLAALLGDPLLA